MQDLLIQLRAMQLFYHSCHNLVGRQSFFADHEAFGEFYGALEGEYDSVAERMIGQDKVSELHLPTLMGKVAAKVQGLPSIEVKENIDFFKAALSLEQQMQAIGTNVMKMGATEGTKNLIAQILDNSEVRVYKIKQRIKK